MQLIYVPVAITFPLPATAWTAICTGPYVMGTSPPRWGEGGLVWGRERSKKKTTEHNFIINWDWICFSWWGVSIQLLNEFQITICDPIIFEDNQSCLKMLQEEKLTSRSKLIDVKYYFLKIYWNVERFFIFCPTESMLADILTKSFQRIRICK